jgi:NAD(P)H-flavin reductase
MRNLYLPKIVKIKAVEEQSPTVKLFRLENKFPKDKNGMVFIPGQFFLIGEMGYGEAPFGALSSPYEKKYLEFAIRKAGNVTNYLHSLQAGDTLEIRGPYGNGFPIDFMKEKDVVLVTGGCGIPPIASLIEYIIVHREHFGNVYLLYGAKTPDELLLKDRIERWKKSINVILTIDKPAFNWQGPVGFVSDLIKEIKINELDAVAAMCGPGPMMDALEKILKPLGISDRRIFVNMERKMQCGIGKCQHCTCGKNYVCLNGPVFTYDEIENAHD